MLWCARRYFTMNHNIILTFWSTWRRFIHWLVKGTLLVVDVTSIFSIQLARVMSTVLWYNSWTWYEKYKMRVEFLQNHCILNLKHKYSYNELHLLHTYYLHFSHAQTMNWYTAVLQATVFSSHLYFNVIATVEIGNYLVHILKTRSPSLPLSFICSLQCSHILKHNLLNLLSSFLHFAKLHYFPCLPVNLYIRYPNSQLIFNILL